MSSQTSSHAVEFQEINHVQLAMPAGQEEAAIRFYNGVLGLTVIEKPEPLRGRGGCWFGSAHVQVHLGVDRAFTPARKAHPAFVVSSLSALQRRLEDAGVEVVRDTQLGGYERFYAADPFGNRIEFMERVG